jgi:PAS domain-containing protein
MSVAAKFSWTPRDSGTELRLMFENAPVGLAQCQPQGAITALNPVLEQMIGDIPATGHSLSLGDLIDPEDQPSGERVLRELFEGKRDSFQLHSNSLAAKAQAMRWTACGSTVRHREKTTLYRKLKDYAATEIQH